VPYSKADSQTFLSALKHKTKTLISSSLLICTNTLISNTSLRLFLQNYQSNLSLLKTFQEDLSNTPWQITMTTVTKATPLLEGQVWTDKMFNKIKRLFKETTIPLNLQGQFKPTPMLRWRRRSSNFRIFTENWVKTPSRHWNLWHASMNAKSPMNGMTLQHSLTSASRFVVKRINGSAQLFAICNSQLHKKHGLASDQFLKHNLLLSQITSSSLTVWPSFCIDQMRIPGCFSHDWRSSSMF